MLHALQQPMAFVLSTHTCSSATVAASSQSCTALVSMHDCTRCELHTVSSMLPAKQHTTCVVDCHMAIFLTLLCCYLPDARICSTMRTETGEVIHAAGLEAGLTTGDVDGGNARNNYSRPEGQNVGNFLTDRNSSRVLAPPGGGSSIVFGDDEPAAAHMASRGGRASGALTRGNPNAMSADNPMSGGGAATNNYATNNYARSGGQNVGNFLTDRKTVKVAAPPGGASQITFG